MDEDFVLTDGERHSEVWRKLYVYLHERIATHRALLEGPVDQREADKLRGRIAEDKWLMSLNEDVPETIPNLYM